MEIGWRSKVIEHFGYYKRSLFYGSYPLDWHTFPPRLKLADIFAAELHILKKIIVISTTLVTTVTGQLPRTNCSDDICADETAPHDICPIFYSFFERGDDW